MSNHSRMAVAIAAAFAFGLAGCAGAADAGGADAGAGGASAGAADGPDPVVGTVTVFAAASLTEVFGAIEKEFELQHPDADVLLSFGGSGNLAAQITQGAPADVFASAGPAPMSTVSVSGDVASSTVFTTNTLEIAVPIGNPANVTGLADFTNPNLVIALCDPSVPCGAAAEKLMLAAGLTAAPDTLEPNVKSVLTKVELGEADAGLVYVTDVVAAGERVEGIPIPSAGDIVNEYPIAVLTNAPNPDGGRAWVELVLSASGQAALAAAGFVSP